VASCGSKKMRMSRTKPQHQAPNDRKGKEIAAEDSEGGEVTEKDSKTIM